MVAALARYWKRQSEAERREQVASEAHAEWLLTLVAA
jgi:hypothetical protein